MREGNGDTTIPEVCTVYSLNVLPCVVEWALTFFHLCSSYVLQVHNGTEEFYK